MGVYFVHLACRAAFHVFSNKVAHARPPVVGGYCSNSVRNSRVASRGRVVKEGKHPPLKVVISHNDEGIAFPPEVAGAMFDIKLSSPTIKERVVFLDSLEVYNLGFDVSVQIVVLDAVNLDEVIVVPQIIIVFVSEPCCIETDGAGSKGACLEFNYWGVRGNEQMFGQCNNGYVVIWVWGVVWSSR
jgi:hypothetical protein